MLCNFSAWYGVFSGILILATNRVGILDDALISRVHVVLHYTSLDDNQRMKIWTLFFEKLEKEKRREMKISRRAKQFILQSPKVTELKWNGREIRNGVSILLPGLVEGNMKSPADILFLQHFKQQWRWRSINIERFPTKNQIFGWDERAWYEKKTSKKTALLGHGVHSRLVSHLRYKRMDFNSKKTK